MPLVLLGLVAVGAFFLLSKHSGPAAPPPPLPPMSSPFAFTAGNRYSIDMTVGPVTAPPAPTPAQAQALLDQSAPGVLRVAGVSSGMSVVNGAATWTMTVDCIKSADLSKNPVFAIGGGLLAAKVTLIGRTPMREPPPMR